MPSTSTDSGSFSPFGGFDDTQPVPVYGLAPGPATGSQAEAGQILGPGSGIPSMSAVGVEPIGVIGDVAGSTFEDLELAALWRPRRHLFAFNQSTAGRGLIWLGATTISYAGAIAAALTIGPSLRGAAAFILIAFGIGLALINIVGVFVLVAMGDPRPTSRTYMEGHLAARRLATLTRQEETRTGS
ncbi:MAG: hypothetical protein GY724_02430 [Actinomycetia bacterium]|nr:hypothetical protein [Actinomycetes bacterium]MCP4223579.1 hypothetical protein [Actinomycetes bacterium]MCP5035194.1 hypothetical protein [Actinomycetes bacterium]